MLNSYTDLLTFIDNAILTESTIYMVQCQYLEEPTQDLNAIALKPDNFAQAIADPAWLDENLLEIIKILAIKNADGSIMGLLKFLSSHQDAEQKIINKINQDKNKEQAILGNLEYNFLYIASIYVNFKALTFFLLKTCNVDINYQHPTFNVSALQYAINYASHQFFIELINYGISTKSIDLNLKDKFGHTLLASAIGGLYFNQIRPITYEEKVEEIVFLLNNGACALDEYALKESLIIGMAQKISLELLQQGAGLIKPQLRKLDTFYYKHYEKIPGFDDYKFNTAAVVLVGTNKTNGESVWLYDINSITTALKDPNISINTNKINKHLNIVDIALLGSVEVLRIFLPQTSLFNICVSKINLQIINKQNEQDLEDLKHMLEFSGIRWRPLNFGS
jgi:hypothetical protein